MASPFPKKYDVFLSFRGEDTRNTLTSHLHKALLDRKIEAYIDGRLERGEEISSALLSAIQESKLSVIIFSENYASSRWCLDELVHILRCKEKNGQIVLPVFYHVSPSDVRKQQGSYAVAFSALEERFKDDLEKVNQWRSALTNVANLSGWDAPVTRPESELVERIVEDVMEKLHCISSGDDFDGLVGMEERIKHIESLLLVDLSLDVRIIGIWGMGGLGKTSLAHLVFRRLCHRFEGYCFLENVREEWQNHGRIGLRNRFFAELLGDKTPYVVNMMFVKDRLCRKKVLIVLDDVDDSDQFEYLVGGRDWFRPGSRVIVTTRNKQVLKNIEADTIYMAEGLNEDEALQLFSWHAFRRNSPTKSYLDLSRKVIDYASGLPLALKVLGSHLYSKSSVEWESALAKLKVVPNKKIHNILQISYDGLDDKEKDVFLDIACFFKGKWRSFVKKLVEVNGSFNDIIRVLVDKSLLTVTHYDQLWMHDLVQEMGHEIVRQEFIKEPGMRSRLYIADEVLHVLKNDAGTAKVEAISLNTSEIRGDHINLKPTIFKNMYNLRLLQIFECPEKCKLHLPQGLETLPDTLRYLNWPAYPSKSLPSSFLPQNLVELNMPSSQLEQLSTEFQHLWNLKAVNLSFSKKLTHIPDLSQACLKSLSLKNCMSLVELPSLTFEQVFDKHVSSRKKVGSKSFIGGNGYWRPKESDNRLPLWCFDAFDYFLNLSGCLNLKFLSEMCGNIKYICLHGTAVEELHPSIWSLENLCHLDLNSCRGLKNLPSNIYQLVSLQHLDLGGCLSIDKFPDVPKNIRTLHLSRTAIEKVPSSSFECLHNLEDLCLENCTRLKTLPTSIFKLKSLVTLNLSGCSNFKSFPEILQPMERLEILYLDGTGIRELHSSIENLTRLRWLFLTRCENLEFVPNNIYNIRCLEFLDLSESPKLESLPVLSGGFHGKIELDLSYDNILKVPDWHCGLSSLPMVDLSGIVTGRRHVSMEQLSNMLLFSRGNGERNEFILADKFTAYLHDCRCMPLHDSNFSTLCVPLHNSNFSEFLYCGCSRFNEEQCKEMALEFLYCVMCDANYFLANKERGEETVCPRINLCCPGNRIPWWFDFHSKGSSIYIKLPPYWHDSNFLGFFFCFVVEYEHYCFDLKRLNYRCEYHFKTNCGESHGFSWSFQRPRNAEGATEIKFLNSDHMYMGLLLEDYHDYHDAAEVSFEFRLEQFDWETLVNNGNYKVKECGIYFLYLDDAVEFGIFEYFSQCTTSVVCTSEITVRSD